VSTSQKAQLPEGWRWAKLGGHDGVAKIVNGSTPSTGVPRFWNGHISWATPADLGKLDDIYLYNTERKITDEGYKSCSTQLLPIGTILFTSRAPVGHIAIAGNQMCTNQGFKSLIPRKGIDSLYLYFAIRAIIPEILKKAHGNTFDELTKPALSQFEIPLPPTTDQQNEIGLLLRNKIESIKSMRLGAEQKLEAVTALPAATLREFFNLREVVNA